MNLNTALLLILVTLLGNMFVLSDNVQRRYVDPIRMCSALADGQPMGNGFTRHGDYSFPNCTTHIHKGEVDH